MTVAGLEKYVPQDASDAVQLATNLFDARDDLWSLPLFSALSRIDLTDAAVWAERCVERMLPKCRTPHLESLQKDLVTLKKLRDQQAPREEFFEHAHEIWYRGLQRDWIQTAIARLYSGVGNYLYSDPRRRGIGIAWGIDFSGAVSLMAKGEDFPEQFLEIATEEFQLVLRRRESEFDQV